MDLQNRIEYRLFLLPAERDNENFDVRFRTWGSADVVSVSKSRPTRLQCECCFMEQSPVE